MKSKGAYDMFFPFLRAFGSPSHKKGLFYMSQIIETFLKKKKLFF